MPADRIRAYSPDGDVVHDMDMPSPGPAEFDSDAQVAYVVFYAGDLDTEAVVGKVEVNSTGHISVDLAG